jgi:hypothetical protein
VRGLTRRLGESNPARIRLGDRERLFVRLYRHGGPAMIANCLPMATLPSVPCVDPGSEARPAAAENAGSGSAGSKAHRGSGDRLDLDERSVRTVPDGGARRNGSQPAWSRNQVRRWLKVGSRVRCRAGNRWCERRPASPRPRLEAGWRDCDRCASTERRSLLRGSSHRARRCSRSTRGRASSPRGGRAEPLEKTTTAARTRAPR